MSVEAVYARDTLAVALPTVTAGALVMLPRYITAVKQLLRQQTGSRAVGSKVTPYHGPPGGPPMKAVHVVGGGVVAALMEPEACPAVPEAMRRLLADGDVAFVPGIRVNSAVCAAVG